MLAHSHFVLSEACTRMWKSSGTGWAVEGGGVCNFNGTAETTLKY